MKKNFTTIRTKYGKFEVIKDDKKYFLVYLEEKGTQTGKVGYLINEDGNWYLQEAFFDNLNMPHFNFRPIFRQSLPIDDDIRKDLIDNLIAACYQVEDAINLKGVGKCVVRQSRQTKFWKQIIDLLRNGSNFEAAYLEVGGINND